MPAPCRNPCASAAPSGDAGGAHGGSVRNSISTEPAGLEVKPRVMTTGAVRRRACHCRQDTRQPFAHDDFVPPCRRCVGARCTGVSAHRHARLATRRSGGDAVMRRTSMFSPQTTAPDRRTRPWLLMTSSPGRPRDVGQQLPTRPALCRSGPASVPDRCRCGGRSGMGDASHGNTSAPLQFDQRIAPRCPRCRPASRRRWDR